MAKVHGKNTVIKLGAIDISQYCNASSFNRTNDVHDITTYGKNDHVYNGGLGDGTFSLGGCYESISVTGGPRAIIEPLIGTTVSLTRQPEGVGVGKAQDVVNIVITGYDETSPVADMVTWAMTAQLSDAINSTSQ